MSVKDAASIAVVHRVRGGQFREQWGWFAGLGFVQFLVGTIALGLLLLGLVHMLLGSGLLQDWLVAGLWLINLFISIHMISCGLSLFMFGMAAKNQTANEYSAFTDVLTSSDRTSGGGSRIIFLETERGSVCQSR